MNFIATALAWMLMISVGATVLAFYMDEIRKE